MRKILKENNSLFLMFVFFLLTLLFFNTSNADTVWNYGMAHAIKIGEIPYKDFNIITTPLYPLFMSSFLFLKDSYFVYLFEQAILCTVLFYFVHKELKEKTILFYFLVSIPFFTVFLPNYNFFAFLLVIMILSFEKKENNDILIGILLGLLFCTKHTIGISIILFSLISTFSWKRIGKRFLFSLIPIGLLFLYLNLTNSLKDFINLSFLGLFDFGKSNATISIFYLIVGILIFGYTCYQIYKNPKDYHYYYLLGSFSFIVPIVNMDHAVFLIGVFLFIVLRNMKTKIAFPSSYLILLFSGIILVNAFFNYSNYSGIQSEFQYFSTRFMSQEDARYVSNLLKKYKDTPNSYMISMDSMLYDIEANHKITYFDIPLYGNFGYNGIDHLKKKIDSMHGAYFFIQESKNPQFIGELCDYIKEKGTFIESIGSNQIYQMS